MAVDLRQSKGWSKYLQSIGWEIEELKVQNSKCKIYIRKIPLIGSLIKIQRPAEIPPVSKIDELARKRRALLVKLEPLAVSSKQLAGFETDPIPNLSAKTIVNDLTKGEKEIWTNLSQDAKRSIKRAQNNKLRVMISEGDAKNFSQALNQFHQLLSETGQRRRFWVSSLKQLQNKCGAFGKNAIIFLVYPPSYLVTQLPSYPIAGALFLVSGNTAYYHHAASSPLGQELFAPYLLLWKAILFFKSFSKTYHRSPIIYLDHEGIVDPRFPQTKRWEKFTVFKRKWGGEEIVYSSPLVKFYNIPIKILFKFSELLC